MEINSMEEQFNCLSIKFIFVCEDFKELNSLLSELNGLDYKNQKIQHVNSIFQFIESMTGKIKVSSDANIIAKACHLMKQLLNKQKVSLPEQISIKVVQWIVRCCETKSLDLFFCEAIDVLTLLFKGNRVAARKNFSKLLTGNGILLKFINKSPDGRSLSLDNTPQELFKSSLSCIESILLHLVEDSDVIDEENLKVVAKSIINFVFNLKQDEFPDLDFILIITSCLNSLKLIAQIDSEFASENIGEILGICKSFILFSIPDFPHQPPVKIASSQQAIMEPVAIRPNKRAIGMATKAKRTRNKVNKKKVEVVESHRTYGGFTETQTSFLQFPSFPAYKTSDSDYSDTEHNRDIINRHKQSKLRLSALSLLSVIAVTVEKKFLFGYWHSLFTTEESTAPTLINCVLKDSSPRCRILALQTIIQLLKNSKPFLIQAENKEKAPTTFTPFSVTLGNMIVFTYEKLTHALIKEGDLTVLTQILKCISIFIPATPFHRLKPGIVTGFVKYVRLLIRHKDPTIKVAALIVMGNLISISDVTSEIYELVEIPKSKIEFSWKKIDESIRSVNVNQENDEEIVDLEFEDEDEESEENEVDTKTETVKMSWLLQTVLENLGVFNGAMKQPSPATSVRVESLQILGAMASHFLLLKDHLLSISMGIVKSLQVGQADEKMYSSRALEFLGSSINIYLTQDKTNLQDIETSLSFWLSEIPNIVEKIQDITQPPALRASLADGLANIGVHVFEKLEHQKQILLISILTGCSYDDDSSVKSSAIRALAVYVLFPSLRTDLCFVENTIESILRIIKDPNVLQRTKASWALGNVVDALLIVKNTQMVNEKLLKQIFETSLEATNDNDRVKMNAVRIIGNLFTLLNREHLADNSWLKLFQDSVQSLHTLLLNCGNVKVKWNVCYSFASLMKNSILFTPELKLKWQDLVFPALCSTIRTSPNFKVRINACIAFTIPNREHFGGFFIEIWCCLLAALEQSNNLTDFNEYKHRDTLQDQLCLSICHILTIATSDDVIPMKNEVFPLIDITKQNWNRVFNRWLPECQGKILTAAESLKIIPCKSSEHRNSIEILVSCFKPLDQF